MGLVEGEGGRRVLVAGDMNCDLLLGEAGKGLDDFVI